MTKGSSSALSRTDVLRFAARSLHYIWGVTLLILGIANTMCVIPSHSCTLVGCGNAATITLRTANGAWTAGTYTIELSVDGTPGTCTLSIPDPPASAQGTCSSARNVFGLFPLSLFQESKCVTVTQGSATGESCTPIPGQFHLSLELSGTPVQVGLTVSRDGSQLASQTVAMQYQTVRPNGPDCEPTCHQALADLSLAP
jgi:hypothetical protein